MARQIITHGDPGEVVLASLREMVYRGIGDQRGPRVAPVVLEVPGEGEKPEISAWPARDSDLGDLRPVSFRFRQATVSVAGQVLGPFSGPSVVQGVEIYSANTELSVADSWSVLRVDFSATPGLQTLVFSSTSPPTGYGREGLSLFDQSIYAGAGETTTGQQPGWFPWAPAVAGGTVLAQLPVGLYVPFQPLFIKAYVQNDALAALSLIVVLLMRFWAEDAGSHNGALRSGEPQIVYPRRLRAA